MNFKWNLSWIGLLGKARRDKDMPKYKKLDLEAFDGSKQRAIELDEYGVIGKPKLEVKVYGILRGQYEWEELDEQLFLSKEKARSQCLSYVETANFQPPFKDQYAETSEGYWSTGDFGSFIQLKEFIIS